MQFFSCWYDADYKMLLPAMKIKKNGWKMDKCRWADVLFNRLDGMIRFQQYMLHCLEQAYWLIKSSIEN